jgi:aryl-alcohol dehydrogenase-like predicted oxidoreductase
MRAAAAVRDIAKRKGATAGQIALAWLLHKGPDIVPIPGTKRAARVDENLGALDVSLSAAEAASLSAAIPPGAAAGGRYADAFMKAVYL